MAFTPDQRVYGQAKLTIVSALGSRTVTATHRGGTTWPNAHIGLTNFVVDIVTTTTGVAPASEWLIAIVEDNTDVSGNFADGGSTAPSANVLAVRGLGPESTLPAWVMVGDGSNLAYGNPAAMNPAVNKGGTYRIVISAGSTQGRAIRNSVVDTGGTSSDWHADSDGTFSRGGLAVVTSATDRWIGGCGHKLVWTAKAVSGGGGPDGKFRYRDTMTLTGSLRPAGAVTAALIVPKAIKVALSTDVAGATLPDGVYRPTPNATGDYTQSGVLIDTDFGQSPGGIDLFTRLGVNDRFGDTATPAGEMAGIWASGTVVGVTEDQRAWCVFTNAVTAAVNTVEWAASGAMTSSQFTVSAVVQLVGTLMQLKVANNAGMTGATTYTAVPIDTLTLDVGGPIYVGRMTATGLSPFTQYYYQIIVDGVLISTFTGKSKTSPTAGVAGGTYTVGVGSCHVTGHNPLAMSRLAGMNPSFNMHIGDWHYYDIGTNNLPQARRGIYQQAKIQHAKTFLNSAPMVYMYDDHDSGPNNNHMGFSGFADFMANSIAAYKQLLPHFDQAQPVSTGWTRGMAQVFNYGLARFLVPDLRFQRTLFGAGGIPTMLGDGTTPERATWNQKQWLKDQLLLARTQGVKLACIVSAPMWSVLGDGGGWLGFSPDERTEIEAFIRDNDVPEVLIVSGDAHVAGFDDGQSRGVVSGSNIPTIMVSPWSIPSGAGLPLVHVWNGTPKEHSNPRQFGVITFQDTGGFSLRWIAHLYADVAINDPVGNMEADSRVTLGAVGFTDHPNISATPGTTLSVRVDRSWFGFASVQYATAALTGQSGVDYTHVSGGIDMAAHRNNYTISVPIPAGASSGRTFQVVLSSPSSINLAANKNPITVTIS